MAVERADVCILMIDGNDGISEQDEKIAGLSHEAGKACIIAVNKWDLVEKDGKGIDGIVASLDRPGLSYMPSADAYLYFPRISRASNLKEMQAPRRNLPIRLTSIRRL